MKGEGLVLVGWRLERTRCNGTVHVTREFPRTAHAVLHVDDPLVGGPVRGVLHVAWVHLEDGPDSALRRHLVDILGGGAVVLQPVAEDAPSQHRGHHCLGTETGVKITGTVWHPLWRCTFALGYGINRGQATRGKIHSLYHFGTV